jgi:DNA-damage-inducible protein D
VSDIVPAGELPFEQIRHVDEQGEYWTARELGDTLGYRTNYRNFKAAIERAKKACKNSGNPVSDHFAETRNMVPIGSGAERDLDDYRLTRYACYLIAQNSDPKKDIVAKAQTYFAVKTRGMELMEDELAGLITQLGDDPLAEAMRRILFRQELTDAHKRLFDQAREAGILTKEQWAWFMNQGYKGLYAGRTRTDIQAVKGLKRTQEISEYMSALETFANVLRAMVARQRLREGHVSTIAAAGRTHFQAGQDVRQIFLAAGIPPEELPTPTKSYKQIVKEEAERIRREEELEQGLWGQLPPKDKGDI